MSFISLSEHSKEKAIYRFGMSADRLEYIAEQSILHGYSTGDAPTGRIRKYLERKRRGSQKIYVFSGYIFIFSKDLLLITTYRMPRYLLMDLSKKERKKLYKENRVQYG